MLVLDASALIALVAEEQGWQLVKKALQDEAIINTVNYSELLFYFKRHNYNSVGITEHLLDAGLLIQNFSKKEAEISASLESFTKPYGLSLGDRACLASAINLNLEVLTADKIWAQIKYPDLQISLIR